jgi:hypothetical protein
MTSIGLIYRKVASKVLSKFMQCSKGERGVRVSLCSVQRGTRKTECGDNQSRVYKHAIEQR